MNYIFEPNNKIAPEQFVSCFLTNIFQSIPGVCGVVEGVCWIRNLITGIIYWLTYDTLIAYCLENNLTIELHIDNPSL